MPHPLRIVEICLHCVVVILCDTERILPVHYCSIWVSSIAGIFVSLNRYSSTVAHIFTPQSRTVRLCDLVCHVLPLFVVVVVIPYKYNYTGASYTCQVFSQYSFDISPNNIPITDTDTQRPTHHQKRYTVGNLTRHKLFSVVVRIVFCW